jgi:pyruvate-formate lyase-activating enzyme
LAEKRRDPGAVKFGHALHLKGETIPKLPGGKKLDCAFCHEPDTTEAYMRPIRFEQHCRVCHSLQFDGDTPELHLPHGDPAFVSAFLRSLPKQYADVASRGGVTGETEQKQFVEQKLQALGAKVSTGEEFERRVFFSTAIRGPDVDVGSVSGAERALFPGCAYCHNVKSVARGSAEITRPKLSERWLTHARFDHAKHTSVACTHCHAAEKSKETADIILPAKETCAACHSPRGGVKDSCVTCHAYHKAAN